MAGSGEVILERVSSSSSSRIVPIENETTSRSQVVNLGFLLQYHSDGTQTSDFGIPGNHETIINMQEMLGGQGSRKELPQNQDDWLPITESRKGNTFTAASHLLCSGNWYSGPFPSGCLCFTRMNPNKLRESMQWFWGTLCLLILFSWQLYTTWLLIHLHEPVPGTRYSRYVVLSIIAFGPKLGKLLAIFPTMYLSGGTCVFFIITGGEVMKHLYQIMCGDDAKCIAKTLSGAEWFLIFVCLAIFIAQFFPSLNSFSGVALIGSIAAVLYTTLLWTVSISKGRPEGVIYEPAKTAASEIGRVRGIMNALGIISLAFRGHNVVLEIQGTFPTNPQRPSRQNMWKAVKASYLFIAICLFPVAIVGYWAYGNLMPANGIGILSAFSSNILKHHKSKYLMGAVYLTMLIHFFSAFQIYAMPVYDNLERIYVTKKNKPCPKLIRSAIRFFFGGLTYLISVAFPFLGSLGPFIGAITLPLTFAYPCFMWIVVKKPKSRGLMWCLNFGLGSLGIVSSVLFAAAALWNLVARGLDANFFHPH